MNRHWINKTALPTIIAIIIVSMPLLACSPGPGGDISEALRQGTYQPTPGAPVPWHPIGDHEKPWRP